MKTTKTNHNAEAAQKRAELRTLTKILIAQAQMMEEPARPNELLRDYYAEKGHTTLNTFNQWKELGYKVKKGAHALLLWSKPIKKGSQEQPDEQPTETATTDQTETKKEKDFYNYISLFSNLQVEKA